MYANKYGKAFDKQDFYQNPNNYRSMFADKYLQFLSVLYHCMFWNQDFPKIITLEDSRRLTVENRFRLFAISDITCEPDGSIELNRKSTKIPKPYYLINPYSAKVVDDFEEVNLNTINEPYVLYHSVDHLPAELPIDASENFSNKFYPVLKKICEYLCTGREKKDTSDIDQAIISWKGKLLPKFEYLYKYLNVNPMDIN